MNVALHSQYLGIETAFISRVGNDELGLGLLEFVKDKSLDTSHIQLDHHHQTSRVVVDNTDKENIRYEIVQPVAWDFMEWNIAIQEKVDQADVFVFGSLAARSSQSQDTLFRLLETTTLKVLDINLRPPHYSTELLGRLLQNADVLKINEDELEMLIKMGVLDKNEEKAISEIADRYALQLVCMTKGGAGAMIYDGKEFYRHPGYQVDVEDTVGAGDAFLSGFISQYLKGNPPREILDFACALGALVATQKGGTPNYEISQINSIQNQRN